MLLLESFHLIVVARLEMVKKNNKEGENELRLRAVTEIVAKLIETQKRGEAIDLNKLKCAVAARLGMASQPRLVDIISAVPNDYRELLLPKLKAKPVRTASGIAVVAVMRLVLCFVGFRKMCHIVANPIVVLTSTSLETSVFIVPEAPIVILSIPHKATQDLSQPPCVQSRPVTIHTFRLLIDLPN